MLRSTDRIRTTHVGSLARPSALLDLMQAAAQGRPVDPGELAEEIHPTIVWAKFEALAEGARRATARLW
jgi:5-methyltetrahydropteroyltriglutamate--homocysteine methyltransferase